MRQVIVFIVALIIGFVLGWFYGRGRAPAPVMTAARPVTVGVTGGVSTPISVIPDPVNTVRRDTLIWEHAAADSFFIDLVDPDAGVPTVDSLLRGDSLRPALTTIREDAPFDTFKYAVTVWFGADADTLDPRVVVKPDER